jgi:hypothetical protein
MPLIREKGELIDLISRSALYAIDELSFIQSERRLLTAAATVLCSLKLISSGRPPHAGDRVNLFSMPDFDSDELTHFGQVV